MSSTKPDPPAAPRAESDGTTRTRAALSTIDRIFFFLGTAAAAWMAYLTIHQVVVGGLHDWWLVLVSWVLVAYLLLPRVQTILARIYVPDYFIGRTRIHEGLLGDPVNVALLGTETQIRAAMTAAGWRPADELGLRSGLRIVASTIARRPYPTAPVSALYLFNRLQDFAYEQEVAGSPSQRHHVRFWATAPGWRLPGGTKVDWVAAGTFDRKVGISDFTLQVTHKVTGDTDIERDHVVGTLLSANPAASETVIDHFSSGYHSRNGGGDAIETDGNLPIVDLTKVDEARSPSLDTGVRLDTVNLGSQARAVLQTVRDTAASNRSKRPLALYVSSMLMILRAVVAVLTVVAAGPRVSTASWWLGLTLVSVAGVGYLVLALRTFTGHPVARLIAMSISLATIGAALLLGHAHGELGQILWVIGLALDLGILFTLSGDDVRAWHLRTTSSRRRR